MRAVFDVARGARDAAIDRVKQAVASRQELHGFEVDDAARGYKEIHLRALKLLKAGGTLATFCCSHHVDAVTFQDAILAAAVDAHRTLRRVAIFTQGPDHPVIPAIPETEYLKGFAFELVR